MAKYFLIITSILFSCQLITAQSNSLQWLDIELSNYPYPHEVSYLALNNQEQELRMAYMDVKPENYNGKILYCFTVKTSTVRIGKPRWMLC